MYAIFPPPGQIRLFIIPITVSTGPRECGTEATGGHAPSIGEEATTYCG